MSDDGQFLHIQDIYEDGTTTTRSWLLTEDQAAELAAQFGEPDFSSFVADPMAMMEPLKDQIITHFKGDI